MFRRNESRGQQSKEGEAHRETGRHCEMYGARKGRHHGMLKTLLKTLRSWRQLGLRTALGWVGKIMKFRGC